MSSKLFRSDPSILNRGRICKPFRRRLLANLALAARIGLRIESRLDIAQHWPTLPNLFSEYALNCKAGTL